MSQYQSLIKIIKKGKKINDPINIEDYLTKYFSDIYNESISRELYFVGLYYGLVDNAMTLENIGKSQANPLTRERVRQIIDTVITKSKDIKITYESPFTKTLDSFMAVLKDNKFLRLEELTKDSYFNPFKKNVKGLISFLNDCDIRQIAYRKKYYFYPKSFNRKEIINLIQKENKTLRREQTVVNMSNKAKTVTYVPDEVREHLLNFSNKNKINLNPLYEKIVKDFMDEKPYVDESFVFSRTKSWKARKGKAEWQQIGIYIEKDIFISMKYIVENIKKDLKKNVSLMSFICQAFVWHYEKHKLSNKN